MIRTHYFRVNLRFFNGVGERLGRKNIIYTPPDIAGTCASPLCPPSIKAIAVVEQSKSIYEARINEVLETFSLFLSIPFISFVFFGPRKVMRHMSNIQVAAENYRLFSFKLFAMGQASRVPFVMSERYA